LTDAEISNTANKQNAADWITRKETQMSQATPDPNVILAEATRLLVKDFVAAARKATGNILNRRVLPYLETFEAYLGQTHARCSAVRMITNRDSSYPLKSVYVEGRYRHGDTTFTDAEICYRLRENKNVVVFGLGGIGKTVLLKNIWMTIFEDPQGKIPIYIELRRLSNLSSQQLRTYIRNTLSPPENSVPEDSFNELLKAGCFVFMFDGFDELSESARTGVQSDIMHLAEKYPENGIIVSSRASDIFYSWELFEVFEAKPFSKDQTVALIKKADFDPKIKSKFIDQIIAKQYERYAPLLQTPLLALMMLLTFRQFADVSPKAHIFYRHAYSMLYSEHDASKEAFRRERKTGLDEDQFAKIFSLVCFYAYLESEFNLTKSNLLGYIERAKGRSGIQFDIDKYADEAMESVNLLYKEGDIISFVHRSFQEYFSANCIHSYFSDRLPEVFTNIPNVGQDSVVQMCYDINNDVVEESYIVPQYSKYKAEVASFSVSSDDVLQRLVDINATWMFEITQGGVPVFTSIYCSHPSVRFVDVVRSISVEGGGRGMGAPWVNRTVRLNAKLKSLSQRLMKFAMQGSEKNLFFFHFKDREAWIHDDNDKSTSVNGAFNELSLSDPVLTRYWAGLLKRTEREYSAALERMPTFMLRSKQRRDDIRGLFG
jgi:hypothetical protein